MPQVVETLVYSFEELDERAKERARDWYRGCITTEEISEFVIEDAATIADILGIDLRRRRVALMGGGTRYEPSIYWSGFYSQGDGACFEGTWNYAKGSRKAIRAHAPQDVELHRIADGLADCARRTFYRVSATVSQSSRYSHSMTMRVECHDTEDEDIEERVTQVLRDFADWIYSRLREQNDWLNSDEAIDESIEANEYTFSEYGCIS